MEAVFLAPLPASALWGVGPKTAERLAELGIRTIGDIARQPEGDLVRRFGEHGRDLARHARGLDDRPIVTERAAKSISRETTFARNITDGRVLRETLREQAREVSRQLRKEGVCGTTVKLKIRWPDFTTVTRQATRLDATDEEEAIRAMGWRLFDQVWAEGKPVRLLGLGVGGLEVPQQLNLWDTRPAEEADKEKRVRAVLAAVTGRFGSGAIRRGSEVKKAGG
jgi:DNA polymerase-4